MASTEFKKTCPFCEANCAVLVKVEEGEVVGVKGDPADKYSAGYVCAKSQAMVGLTRDPDMLKTPLIKVGPRFEPIGWDEAFDIAAARIGEIKQSHGAEAVATYLGNPSGHSAEMLIYGGLLAATLGSRQFYTAASIDAFPRLLANGSMLGDIGLNALPDVDRASLLVVIGANPAVSNGSMFSRPGLPKHMRAMRERGGRIVVIDPRRTETAELADEYLPIRPSSDALLLLAMVNTFFDEDLVDPRHLTPLLRNVERLRELAAPYPPERAADATGIAADTIRELARALARAEGGAVYGRIGTSCQPFGSICSWLIECLNVLSGNLDREGGLVFARSIIPNLFYSDAFVGDQPPYGRFHTRIRRLGEIGGQLPAAALAEEIEGDAEGAVRALICVAGNPARSFPNSRRLEKALGKLDFMLAVDFYLNETTQHADLILPPVDTLYKASFPFLFTSFMPHTFARFARPVLSKQPGQYSDGDIIVELAARLAGKPAKTIDREHILGLVAFATQVFGNPIGATPEEILEKLHGECGTEQILDLLIRLGEFGDGLGTRPDGLNLVKLQQEPNGIMLGAAPGGRLDQLIRTPDRKIDLAPTVITSDLARLDLWLEEGRFAPPDAASGEFELFGRRDRRSMNSWLHNLDVLAKGPSRFKLMMNPADAAVLDLAADEVVEVETDSGAIVVPVDISDDVARGTVCLPHGWGHTEPETRLRVARTRPGPNFNHLASEVELDVPSGNAVYNGLRVRVGKVATARTRSVTEAVAG